MIRLFKLFFIILNNKWSWTKNAEWTREDRANLRRFFTTATGKKLEMTLRNAAIETNALSVTKSDPYQNGLAYGLTFGINYIDSLQRDVDPIFDESGDS